MAIQDPLLPHTTGITEVTALGKAKLSLISRIFNKLNGSKRSMLLPTMALPIIMFVSTDLIPAAVPPPSDIALLSCSPPTTPEEDKRKGKWVRVDRDLNWKTGIWYLYVILRSRPSVKSNLTYVITSSQQHILSSISTIRHTPHQLSPPPRRRIAATFLGRSFAIYTSHGRFQIWSVAQTTSVENVVQD